MNISEENKDIEFMLKRCLGLCLTDRKQATTGGQAIDFDLTEEDRAYSTTFYKPLALLSHAQRLMGSFSRDVLSYIINLVSRHSATRRTQVQQSGQNPSKSIKTILRDAVLSYERRVLTEDDALACALVGEEFIVHCESIQQLFESQRKEIKNPTLLTLLNWCKVRTDQMRKSWDFLVQDAQLPVAKIREVVKNATISSTQKHGPLSSYDKMEESIEHVYRECTHKVRFTKRVLMWREHWKETTSGFGPGSKLSFEQTRSAPALFELWCFMELANTLLALGQDSLVQCSLLRGSSENPLFHGSGNIDIYFDFHGNPQFLPTEQRVLNRVHVEWFLRNRSDYSKSVVLDTKYKASESVNHLTTLGYMSAFQVERGVVIFRDNLDLGAFKTVENDSRFALCPFGVDREKMFCALHLVPRQTETDRNALVLRKLINRVILT
jgi:hypothetical protein